MISFVFPSSRVICVLPLNRLRSSLQLKKVENRYYTFRPGTRIHIIVHLDDNTHAPSQLTSSLSGNTLGHAWERSNLVRFHFHGMFLQCVDVALVVPIVFSHGWHG